MKCSLILTIILKITFASLYVYDNYMLYLQLQKQTIINILLDNFEVIKK